MNKLQLPSDPTIAKKLIDADLKTKEHQIKAGLLGKLFGSSIHVSIYIVGIVVFLATIAGVVYTFIPDNTKAVDTAEFWKVLTPIITTLIGFILGKSTNKND